MAWHSPGLFLGVLGKGYDFDLSGFEEGLGLDLRGVLGERRDLDLSGFGKRVVLSILKGFGE